ncbi:hypothetical protein [Deminuibacter soli]|uniref:DUF4390 domain-containing protein n=1 Tax=Deminuibacter soli TaxID=2291815 RepID=A0A3E1NR89_9BACT|nr:hypothetical protein [Deminuibacter soli]RFM30334.1 hypothetical protein DXN05_05080 [Deminuibacter soli]
MKWYTLVAALLLCGRLFAQQTASSTCNFSLLFSVHPGEDKNTVIGELKQAYRVTLVNTVSNSIKPEYIPATQDSILVETMTYTLDSSACFQGHTRTLRISFADNKLFKVYVSAEFSKDQFDELNTNLEALRKNIQQTYPYERGIKIKSNDISGFGYTYTKQKNGKGKLEAVTVQYVLQNLPGTPRQFYLLELTWSNLNNTRMQRWNY